MNFSNSSTHVASTLTVGATTSYVPSWPSTVNAGDGIILICFPDTASNVVNDISGYTTRSIGSNSIKIMTKTAGSGESAPTITSTSSVQHGCVVLRLEDCDLSSFTAAYGTGNGGSVWSTPAVTAPSANNIFFYGGLATGGTSDWLAGDEPTITTLINQQAGTSMWFGVGYDQLTSSGSTGTRTPWDNTQNAKVTFAFTIAPSSSVTGTISSTLDNASVSSSGSVSVSGEVASLLSALMVSISADIEVSGSISSSLDDMQVDIDGDVSSSVSGSISSTLEDAVIDIDADASVSGSVDSTLANSTADIDAEVEVPGVSGTISVTLANDAFDAEGEVSLSGVISASTANAVVSIDGDVSVSGALSSTLANARARIRGLSGEDTGGDTVYAITSRTPKGVSLASSVKTIKARKL